MFQFNNEFTEKINELENTKQFSLDEVFNDYFMTINTKFNSFSDFIKAANINSVEELEHPTEELDSFVRSCSNFDSFSDMLNTASNEIAIKYLKKSLFNSRD